MQKNQENLGPESVKHIDLGSSTITAREDDDARLVSELTSTGIQISSNPVQDLASNLSQAPATEQAIAPAPEQAIAPEQTIARDQRLDESQASLLPLQNQVGGFNASNQSSNNSSLIEPSNNHNQEAEIKAKRQKDLAIVGIFFSVLCEIAVIAIGATQFPVGLISNTVMVLINIAPPLMILGTTRYYLYAKKQHNNSLSTPDGSREVSLQLVQHQEFTQPAVSSELVIPSDNINNNHSDNPLSRESSLPTSRPRTGLRASCLGMGARSRTKPEF